MSRQNAWFGRWSKKQAGFLPAQHIGHIGGPVHRHRHRPIDRAARDFRYLWQPFQRPRAARPVADNAAHARHLCQRIGDQVELHLCPSGIGLDHGHIAEAVNDHAGQPIGFGMDKAVMRGVVKCRAQGQCMGNLRSDPWLVDLRLWIAVHHPPNDLGRGVDRDQPKGAPVIFFQPHETSGRDGAGTAVQNYLVGEHPRKTMTDGTGFRPWATGGGWAWAALSLADQAQPIAALGHGRKGARGPPKSLTGVPLPPFQWARHSSRLCTCLPSSMISTRPSSP